MENFYFKFCQKETLYLVSFIAKNRKCYRNCVFPNHLNEEFIKNYVAKSIDTMKNSIEILDKRDVYVLDNQLEEAKQIVKGYIDAYWLDVTEFVVEILQKTSLEFSVIGSMNAKKYRYRKSI